MGSEIKNELDMGFALSSLEESHSLVCIRIVRLCCIRLSVISSTLSTVLGTLERINIFWMTE